MAQRRDITFQSHGETLAAWIWRVDGSKSGGRGPAIVLGHGLGAVKEMGLDKYGDVFSAAGYHVLAFDYRFFGGSTGTPRQLLDIEKQQEDWHAALAFIRSQDFVDPDRVAIFGSSFGGGHVIRVAATDHRVAAAIAQCPFTSGIRSALTLGPIAGLGVGLKAARDMVTGNSMIKLAGKPGEAALMNAPDVIPGYLGLVPDSLDFKNEVLARIGLKILFAYPGSYAGKVKCPIFFGICGKDSVAPASASLGYAKKAPKGEVHHYESMSHFTIYTGQDFDTATKDYCEFLKRVLPIERPPAQAHL